MSKKYFHKLSQEEKERAAQSENVVRDLEDKYKEPEWCSDSQAIGGCPPCIRLLNGEVENIVHCSDCSCVKEEIIPIDCKFCLLYNSEKEEWQGLCSSYPNVKFSHKEKRAAFSGVLKTIAAELDQKDA